MTTTAASLTGSALTGSALTGSQEALIRANMVLVGHMVRETLAKVPAHVHREDLASAGYTALIAAARTYDAARGVPFAKLATARVRTALLEQLREPAHARRADVARRELTTRLGHTPTDDDLAQLLGVGVRELTAAAACTTRHLVTETAQNPQEMHLHRERIGYLSGAVTDLPEQMRLVVETSFLQELPIAEIAAQLQIPESRVRQLRNEALAVLRAGLAGHQAQQNTGTPRNGRAARHHAVYAAQAGAAPLGTGRFNATDVPAMLVGA